jgi:agmatine deiminase
MIIDSETNSLYLADCLPKKHPVFFSAFEKGLKENSIELKWLPGAKDVWARDYMPIQISKDKFVSFTYAPSYLIETKSGTSSISDTESICKAINVKTETKSSIILDGGNVVKSKDKAIVTDRIFRENKGYDERKLIGELETIFEVSKVIVIPSDRYDFTGHADGMVRFLNEDTVLINQYDKDKDEFQVTLRMSLYNAGLDWIELPYNPYNNKPYTSASGIYVNYLEMQNIVFVPVFDINEDECAIKVFEEQFKGKRIVTVKSNDLAQKGGILNCISWNILWD